MIRTENVTKHFGKVCSLHEVSVTVENGSIFGLIGSNGSGKSTLLRTLSGIYKPDSGEIYCCGEPVFENTAIKEKIVYLSDDPYFLPSCNMADMCELYRSLYPGYSMERYKQLVQKFGLEERRKIQTFSKGMQKQVSVLLGLSCMPEYLLCDETFDGLDPVMRQLVKHLIIDDVAERNMCCVIASHNLREVEDIADHIGLLHKGELLFERELDDVRTNISKIQLSFPKDRCDEMEAKLNELQPLSITRRGSLFTVIVRGSEESLSGWIGEQRPQFCEFIPLTLDEVFITEMEERGYEFTKDFIG